MSDHMHNKTKYSGKTEIRSLRKDNRGAAMIVVTCVLMIVSILCLTLVAASYQMLAGVNDEGRDELYYRQAMSFSEVLRDELTATYADEGDKPVLVSYIDGFMGGSEDIVTLEGNTNRDGLFEIDITLDKSTVTGCLLVTVSCVDGDRVMASCKSKYRASGGTYKFYEYY